MNKDYRHVRQDYDQAPLDEKDLLSCPFTMLTSWIDLAIKNEISNPNAASLATVDENGFPQNRVVLVKEVSLQGLVFFTNYESDKGNQLAHHSQASFNFYWREFDRQVRVWGTTQKISRQESVDYFLSRPKLSQISAIASQQSRPVTKQELVTQFELLHQQEKLTCPEHWGGIILQPIGFEFWQGRPNRLHDRFRYSPNSSQKTWTFERLSP